MRAIGFPAPPAPPAMPAELSRARALLNQGALGGLTHSLGDPSVPGSGGPEPFAKFLASKVDDVQKLQTRADHLVHQLRSGEGVQQAEALTAVQQAELALHTMLQVRDKLLEAYRELQQIQI